MPVAETDRKVAPWSLKLKTKKKEVRLVTGVMATFMVVEGLVITIDEGLTERVGVCCSAEYRLRY